MNNGTGLFRWRLKARLRKAPTGYRETVVTRPGNVEWTIQWWGKLGYDLRDRSEGTKPDGVSVQGSFIPVTLVFVKR
jgi:hypothetical protein